MRYRYSILSNNAKTISLRAVAEKIDALDSLAAAQNRRRSYLINEAIIKCIELLPTTTRWFARGWKRCGNAVSYAMTRS